MKEIVVSSGAIIPGPRAAFDRHVADRHPLLHREPADGLPPILDHMTGPAGNPDLGDDPQDQVLGRDPPGESTGDFDCHRFRWGLPDGLGGEDVLDLGGADPEGESTEGPVGRGVAVTADDQHPGLGQALFRADHVDDPLPRVVDPVHDDPVPGAVVPQGFDLAFRQRVEDAEMATGGGYPVIDCGKREVGPADLPPGLLQAGEGLWGGDFVHQVHVGVEQGRVAGCDHMGVPDLLEEGAPAVMASTSAETSAADQLAYPIAHLGGGDTHLPGPKRRERPGDLAHRPIDDGSRRHPRRDG